MKNLSLLLSGLLTLCSGVVLAQFNGDWAEPYQHTSANGFSNECRKVVPDSVNGGIYVLYDVTSNLDPSNNPTANTYSYVLILKYDLFGTLVYDYQIDVGQHSSSGFDRRSGFGLAVDYATGDVFVGYNTYDATTS